ncbi:MAG TPA: hypothetical protein VHC90_20290 [Bryobacteraceae bacterium]|nr:hypothetical protein [Bryobacteraceae bacterium]
MPNAEPRLAVYGAVPMGQNASSFWRSFLGLDIDAHGDSLDSLTDVLQSLVNQVLEISEESGD